MKEKIKYEQYLVKGKNNRYYHIIKLPEPEYAEIYDDHVWDTFAGLDADENSYRMLGKAISLLYVNPTKILYLPKPKNESVYCFTRELVIARPELQLRRSEWVNLRRQISKRTRIENFVYDYDEEWLFEESEKYQNQTWYDLGKKVENIEGNTAFWIYSKDRCLIYHNDIIESVNEERDDCGTYTANGVVLTNKCLINWNKADFPARERR